jgi:hypothetical protein
MIRDYRNAQRQPSLDEIRSDLAAVKFDQARLAAENIALRAEQARLTAENTVFKEEINALRTEVQNFRASCRAPQMSARQMERYYQTILAEKLGAGHMRIAGVGVTDITTPDAHIEVKHWGRYQEVPGQLAKYNQAVPRARLCAYFFGEEPIPERYGQILELMKTFNIDVFAVDARGEIRRCETHLAANDTSAAAQLFATEYVVAETNSKIKRHILFFAFRVWAKLKAQSCALPMDKEMTALFVPHLGSLYSNHWQGEWLTGWKDRKLLLPEGFMMEKRSLTPGDETILRDWFERGL